MCGSALFGKPPKPKPPAQFQDAKSPEYDARSRSTQRESRRRGFSSTILASMGRGALVAPSTNLTQTPTKLGG